MKPINPDRERAVINEHRARLAEVGDRLVHRFGPEVLNICAHPELETFDYTISRAIELEFFVAQTIARMKTMTATDPVNRGFKIQEQMNMAGELEMMQIYVRQYARKLIEARQFFEEQHGELPGKVEHEPA